MIRENKEFQCFLPANFVSNASSSRSSKAANARRAPAILASFLLLPVPYK